MEVTDSRLLDYMKEQLHVLMRIPSPSGYTREVSEYVRSQFEALGFHAWLTTKGGVMADLGGHQQTDAVQLMGHVDTLGAMVAGVKENGALRLTPIGGLQPQNTEAENCTVITRFGGKYTGTFQLENASVHVNGDYSTAKRDFDTMELLLDEDVHTPQDVKKLGIETGDYVCFDPRTVITPSGYIKSRFLDDKLSVAILLTYARYLRESGEEPLRRTYVHVTVYEEVGHGACGTVAPGVTELLSVDMGCVGKGLACTERQVSICPKDSHGPSSYEVTTALILAARQAGADYAVDVYPHYGSDADAALAAGYDVRHGLIGPGVYASHGYERSHLDGVVNTLKLLAAYLNMSAQTD